MQHLKDAVFYTDDWNVFGKVLPSERHIIGKSGTVSIERDNGNTRYHLDRDEGRVKEYNNGRFDVTAMERFDNTRRF